NAMRHHNSVLHGLFKQVPWAVFDKLVDEHAADAGVRTLSTKSQLVALLYAQLSGSVSLREIEAAMASHSARLYHLGAREVSRSTLADANRLRPHEVFTGLFRHMAAGLGPGFRRQAGEALRQIADLYKRRWAIELFFRWVKQTLRITHFLGRSENAVRIQIACALIAYLLIRLANQTVRIVDSPLTFARLVRTNLMHRSRLDQLVGPQPPPVENPNQLL